MIQYQTKEEKNIAIHYAKLLNDQQALDILKKGHVENANEAHALSAFYWRMVNKTVEEDDSNIIRKYNDIDMWLAYLCNSFYIYLCNEGYEKEWEEN